MEEVTGNLPVGSIVQVCYVTRDIEKAIQKWSTIGAGPFFVLDSLELKNRRYRGGEAKDEIIVAVGNIGATMIELVQPLNDAPSIFQEILAEKGESIHHLCPGIKPLSAAAYDAQYSHYVSVGYEPVLTFEVEGVGRNAFFDARDAFGCFLELVEYSESAYRTVEAIMDKHLRWDGARPRRPFSELPSP